MTFSQNEKIHLVEFLWKPAWSLVLSVFCLMILMTENSWDHCADSTEYGRGCTGERGHISKWSWKAGRIICKPIDESQWR